MTKLMLFIGLALAAPTVASAEITTVTVGINGMACPFCAYGIEQKLSALDGVDSLEIHIREGEVDLLLQDGAVISPEAIEAAVDEAGFEVRSLVVRGEGDLRETETGSFRIVFSEVTTFSVEGYDGESGRFEVSGVLTARRSDWVLVVTTAEAVPSSEAPTP
jgi:mercuric ion binding protein